MYFRSKKLKWLTFGALLLLMAFSGSILFIRSSNPVQANLSWPCEPRISGEACSILKQTAIAQSYSENKKQAAVSIEPTIVYPTQVTSIEPEWAKEIKPLDKNAYVQVPIFRHANSVWQLGSVKSSVNGMWTPLYILSSDSNIRKTTLNGTTDDRTKNTKQWNTPNHIGTITITNISVNKIISFTSSSGQSGTFDISSEKWTLN